MDLNGGLVNAQETLGRPNQHRKRFDRYANTVRTSMLNEVIVDNSPSDANFAPVALSSHLKLVTFLPLHFRIHVSRHQELLDRGARC